MTALRDTLRWSSLLLLLCPLAYAAVGSGAGVGALLGIALALLEISAMAFLGRNLLGMAPGPRVVQMTLLFAFLKLPIAAAAVFLAVRLGTASLAFFLAGFAVVYCVLVLAGLREFKTQRRDLFS